MAYVTCLDTKNFTFELPGKCVPSAVQSKYFFVRPKDPYRIPESFSYRGHFARACDFEVRKRNDMQKYIQTRPDKVRHLL